MNIVSIAKVGLRKMLPRPVFLTLKRNVYYGASDLLDTLSGRRQDLVPPKRMMYIGGTAFIKIGDEFFAYFKKFGKLKPESAILDIGCGIGRMARPFTGFLSPAGRLEGFDIDKAGVTWCSKNITKRYPNFRFQYVDVYNKHYNPAGRIKADEFRFPYPDASFDFVFATSVFTHMFPKDVRNYLKEITRVLKPGGSSLLTYFLINPDSRKLITEKKSRIKFEYEVDGVLTQDKLVPEDAIGLEETYVAGVYKELGMAIEAPIHFGEWSGRPDFLSFQDLVVARKSDRGPA